MIDIEKAKLDPTCIFSSPDEVLNAEDISLPDKISILERWAYDAKELMIAEEENMGEDIPSATPNLLRRIQKALIELEALESK